MNNEIDMNTYYLAYWLQVFDITMYEIDGYIFFDILREGKERVIEEISTHKTLVSAQKSINGILIESFVTEVVGEDWEVDDPYVKEIVEILASTVENKAKVLFPTARFRIIRDIDLEYGDVGVTLLQDETEDASSTS